MIRTSIILSPRQEAADRLYFHANGLQIDVATASQVIVRMSHRPVQIYSATRSGTRHQASNLTSQTGSHGQRWQRLMDILDRQGSDVLAELFKNGELKGEWLTALDDRRLNALVSERFSLYLFRDTRLRELSPVSQLMAADQETTMNHYRLMVNQDDQILILPANLIQPALMPEAEQVLAGMQQLPVRLSELGARLRERGVSVAFNGWIAIHILRAEPEFTVPERGLRAWLASRRKPEDDGRGPGYSDMPANEAGSAAKPDENDETEEGDREPATFIQRAPRYAFIAVAAIIAIAILIIAVQSFGRKPQETTATTSVMTMATTAKPTPVVTTTPRPTTTATTTVALPEWYVIARKLNLREEPNLTSKLIRTLTTGESVFILEQTNAEWTKVRTPENEIGYVYAAYISKDKPAD